MKANIDLLHPKTVERGSGDGDGLFLEGLRLGFYSDFDGFAVAAGGWVEAIVSLSAMFM